MRCIIGGVPSRLQDHRACRCECPFRVRNGDIIIELPWVNSMQRVIGKEREREMMHVSVHDSSHADGFFLEEGPSRWYFDSRCTFRAR